MDRTARRIAVVSVTRTRRAPRAKRTISPGQPHQPGAAPMKRRSGFAILMAIALLAIVGMAVMVVSNIFAADLHRTRATVADAQIRQLLIASVVLAQGHLDQKIEGKLKLDLPQ